MPRLARLLVAAAIASTARAADLPADGMLLVVLGDGVAPRQAGQREGRDMEIELSRAGGAWIEAWGYAVGFSRGDHAGTVAQGAAEDGTLRLAVRLALSGDRWTPDGGEASYAVELRDVDGRWTGTYSGSCKDQAVAGEAHATWHARYTRPDDGWRPLAANEHPRLLFRKSDLPLLRRRMETPEGKSIVERMRAQIGTARWGGGPDDGSGRTPSRKMMSYPAADLGVAYQLLGRPAHADAARGHLEAEVMGKAAGVQDIHYAPYLLGAAIALDCCWDAWPADFRGKVVDWVEQQLRIVADGGVRGGKALSGYNPNPWSNHNGIRNAGAALAALCLLGERRSDGAPIEGLDRLARVCARDARRFFQLGLGRSGWFLEGNFYKYMTFCAGPAHVVRAWRSCTGGDLLADWPGAYTVLGEFMASPPGPRGAGGEDRYGAPALGDGQSSGLFSAGLATVRPEHRAGLRWLYDRRFGLQGDRTWGVLWAHHAAFVLMDYPFDVPAQPPHASLPWAAPDPYRGHHLFRASWGDAAQDALVELNLRDNVMRGCHFERIGEAGAMRVWAYGKLWVDGAAIPSLGPVNDFLGGRTSAYEAGDRTASFTVTLDPVWYQGHDAETAPTPEALAGLRATLATFPRAPKPFLDLGVRCTRTYGIDLSGASGAAVLIVLADRIAGAGEVGWRLPLPRGLTATVDGRSAVAGDAQGANLRATVVVPGDARITPHIGAVAGSGTWLTVISVQQGAAPAVQVDGTGLGATLRIGGRTVRLEGDGFLFGR